MLKRIMASTIAIIFLSMFILSCASRPDSIKASYVSPQRYQTWSCRQIEEEIMHIESRLRQIESAQEKKATSDAVSMGVGMVLFWPALFFLTAGEDQKAELSQLKGQCKVLKTMLNRKCIRPQREIEAKQKTL